MADIDIRVKASAEGLDVLGEAADDIRGLGDAATDAGGDSSSKGLSWAAVAVGSFAGNLALEAIKSLPQIAEGLFRAGEGATKAAGGFAAMGGSSDQLAGLRDATEGLVSDTQLMASATVVMQNNLGKSVGTTQEIIDKGGQLGEKFSGDAATGVKNFGKAITEVGSYSTLDDLGLDVQAVKDRFDELKDTMSDKDAWGMAIMEQADQAINKFPASLDSTHPAIDRFKTKIENFRDTTGAAFVAWLDEALSKVDRLFGGAGNSQGVKHEENSGLDLLTPGEGPAGPPKPPGYDSRHSSRFGDITGEGEGYDAYGASAPTVGKKATEVATIEKPKVTRAEFDAIVAGANQASAATAAFGTVSVLAMGGLALSTAVAAGQVGNLTTQGESALSIFKQLQIEMKTLASLTVNVTATRQAGGSGGDATPARGPR